MLNGDPEALKKLRLTEKEKAELKWKRKEDPKLTRKQIEDLAKKKGIKLTEEDIQRMLNGDPEALEKLRLTEDEKEALRWENSKKPENKKLSKDQIMKEIEEAKKRNGGKLSKAELMALLMWGDLSPEEMKQIAK